MCHITAHVKAPLLLKDSVASTVEDKIFLWNLRISFE